MRGALLVPGLGTNLFSIRTATDAGLQVFFSNEDVSFTRNGTVLMEGKRAGKALYRLNIMAKEHPPRIDSALQAIKLQPLSTWHKRFGHVNTRTILRMSSLGSANGLTLFNDTPILCEGCIFGKMHRSPFTRGHVKATSIGDRIHTDVCGPIQVITPGKNRYFVTFKDDLSGWCSTILLKKKSEVENAIQQFVAHVKNQKGKEVKIIRSDNGGEYLSNELKLWLLEHGIHHERSTPYTPQQNGVAGMFFFLLFAMETT